MAAKLAQVTRRLRPHAGDTPVPLKHEGLSNTALYWLLRARESPIRPAGGVGARLPLAATVARIG